MLIGRTIPVQFYAYAGQSPTFARPAAPLATYFDGPKKTNFRLIAYSLTALKIWRRSVK